MVIIFKCPEVLEIKPVAPFAAKWKLGLNFKLMN